MKGKFALVVLLILVATLLFSCGKKDQRDPEEISDAVLAMTDDCTLMLGNSAEDAVKAYNEAKAKAEEKKRKKKAKKKGDADDPANADSTAEYGKKHSSAEMEQRYIGTWEQQGVVLGDGDIDGSSQASCTYVFKADKTYTAKGKDADGKKINESGKWSLNENNQLEAGDYTFGIDDSGYLLQDTGERDGKGKKIKNAYAKV